MYEGYAVHQRRQKNTDESCRPSAGTKTEVHKVSVTKVSSFLYSAAYVCSGVKQTVNCSTEHSFTSYSDEPSQIEAN